MVRRCRRRGPQSAVRPKVAPRQRPLRAFAAPLNTRHRFMESETGSMPWSWREQRRYLQEIAPYFVASVALLATASALGFATSEYAPELSRERRETMREFVSLFTGLPKPYLALAIFLNNALKTLLVIVAGTLGGVPPLVFLLVNGYVLGMVLHSTMQ